MFIIAMDTGNGELKIVSDAEERLVIGGTLAEYKHGGTHFEDPTVTKYRVEKDERNWVAGFDDLDLLRIKSQLVFNRDGSQRYSGNTYRTYAKIGLAEAMGKDSKRGKKIDEVFLLTSVPTDDSKNKKIKDELKAFFNDFHSVYINGERIVVNVVNYDIFSETEAALYDLYLDRDGYVGDDSYDNLDVVVCNIGYGTTDVQRYSNLVYIPLGAETVKTSFLDVIDGCRDWLSETLGKQITRQDVTIQLGKQHGVRRKTFKTRAGETVEGFAEEYDKQVVNVFDTLRTELEQLIPDADDLSKIIVVGGGAMVWGDMFKKWSRRVVIPNDPQFATARGMYKFGKYLARQMANEAAGTKE